MTYNRAKSYVAQVGFWQNKEGCFGISFLQFDRIDFIRPFERPGSDGNGFGFFLHGASRSTWNRGYGAAIISTTISCPLDRIASVEPHPFATISSAITRRARGVSPRKVMEELQLFVRGALNY